MNAPRLAGRFFIEQVAICPPDPQAAIAFLQRLGLLTWAPDTVVASGTVFGERGTNTANLAFNYEATPPGCKPLELEVLHYAEGPNGMAKHGPSVSHLGMHCTEEELLGWCDRFAELHIPVAQEVFTESHTNPIIAGKRKYHYVIFDTRAILGVDLKFIVRREVV